MPITLRCRSLTTRKFDFYSDNNQCMSSTINYTEYCFELKFRLSVLKIVFFYVKLCNLGFEDCTSLIVTSFFPKKMTKKLLRNMFYFADKSPL